MLGGKCAHLYCLQRGQTVLRVIRRNLTLRPLAVVFPIVATPHPIALPDLLATTRIAARECKISAQLRELHVDSHRKTPRFLYLDWGVMYCSLFPSMQEGIFLHISPVPMISPW